MRVRRSPHRTTLSQILREFTRWRILLHTRTGDKVGEIRVGGRGLTALSPISQSGRGIISGSLWGMGDQALISATNFLTLILTARAVNPAAFGGFALVYTALLFANSLQFALITQPHNVLAKVANRSDYILYTSATAASQLAFSAALTALVISAAILAQLKGGALAPVLWAAGPALFAWQLQDFCRRVLYTEGRLSAAFVNDLISYGGQAALSLVLWRALLLNGSTALYAVAATSTAAVVFGVIQLRRSLVARFHWPSVQRNWRFGKWLGVVPAYWLGAQAYMYLAAAVSGVAAAGALKAAQVLMGPLHLIFAAFESILPIRFAAVFNTNGKAALSRMLRDTYMLSTPIVVGYALAVTLLGERLMRFFYGAKYVKYAYVVPIFAAYYILLYAATVVSAAIRAMRRTEIIFKGYAVAAVVAVGSGLIGSVALGPIGAVVGMATGALSLLYLFARFYRGIGSEAAPGRAAGPQEISAG